MTDSRKRIDPLATTNDTHGHTIERYQGDTLKIIDSKTHAPVDLATHVAVSKWYWDHVATRGNDPAPADDPTTIKATTNRTNAAGFPSDDPDLYHRDPGDSDR